jgi:hypothetical protein
MLVSTPISVHRLRQVPVTPVTQVATRTPGRGFGDTPKDYVPDRIVVGDAEMIELLVGQELVDAAVGSRRGTTACFGGLWGGYLKPK